MLEMKNKVHRAKEVCKVKGIVKVLYLKWLKSQIWRFDIWEWNAHKGNVTE